MSLFFSLWIISSAFICHISADSGSFSHGRQGEKTACFITLLSPLKSSALLAAKRDPSCIFTFIFFMKPCLKSSASSTEFANTTSPFSSRSMTLLLATTTPVVLLKEISSAKITRPPRDSSTLPIAVITLVVF